MTATEWPVRVWGRIAVATGLFGCAMLLAERSPACVHALAPVDIFTARATSQILDWLGMDAQRELATLTHPGGFSYQIVMPCTGLLPAALLAAAILCAGASLRARVWAAALGALAVLVLNLVRLVSLFYIGVRHPEAFGFAHSVLWQGVTLVFPIAFFLGWKRRGVASSA